MLSLAFLTLAIGLCVGGVVFGKFADVAYQRDKSVIGWCATSVVAAALFLIFGLVSFIMGMVSLGNYL